MFNRISILSIILVVGFLSVSSTFRSDNGRAGTNGAPGEVTCNTTNCHNTFALNSGGGSVTASSNMIYWKYDPLTTYTISLKVKRTGNHLFGIGAEILTGTNGNAGTLIITDPAHTQIKSATISGVSRRNIVHTLNGGSSQDSATFTFNWTSPDTTAGTVTLYYAGNASNANTSQTGDYIYTGFQQIAPNSGTSVNDIYSTDPVRLYPNPASERIFIHFNTLKSQSITVSLIDLKGAKSFELLNKECLAGENNEVVFLPSGISPGVYLVRLSTEGMQSTEKLIVQ